jgi:hypothetical protein
VIKALAGAPDRLPVLLGNSGVGKSSFAQAGELAAVHASTLLDLLTLAIMLPNS